MEEGQLAQRVETDGETESSMTRTAGNEPTWTVSCWPAARLSDDLVSNGFAKHSLWAMGTLLDAETMAEGRLVLSLKHLVSYLGVARASQVNVR